VGKVGSGTYGTVFKARSKTEKRNYAIKKLKISSPKFQAEGFPVTTLRCTTAVVQR
jgi:serine/threonine protein kinase